MEHSSNIQHSQHQQVFDSICTFKQTREQKDLGEIDPQIIQQTYRSPEEARAFLKTKSVDELSDFRRGIMGVAASRNNYQLGPMEELFDLVNSVAKEKLQDESKPVGPRVETASAPRKKKKKPVSKRIETAPAPREKKQEPQKAINEKKSVTLRTETVLVPKEKKQKSQKTLSEKKSAAPRIETVSAPRKKKQDIQQINSGLTNSSSAIDVGQIKFTKKGAFIREIFSQIQKIDLEAPHASAALLGIQKCLESHLHRFNEKEQPQIRALIHALEVLRDPNGFRPTKEEEKAIKDLGYKIDSRIPGREYDPKMVKNIQKDAKTAFLEILKESSTPTALRQLPLKYEEVKTQAVVERLTELVGTTGSEQLQQKLLNFALIINHFDSLKKRTRVEFQSKWDMLKGADPEVGQKMEKINRLNWMGDFEHHFEWILEQHMAGVQSEIISTAKTKSPQDMVSVIGDLEDRFSEEEIFNRMFASGYDAIFSWIVDHKDQIVQAYSQEGDIHRNMGPGTCYQNSIERLKVLIENPEMTESNIRMGSSSRGRIAKVLFLEAFKPGVSSEKRLELVANACAKQGVRLLASKTIRFDTTSKEASPNAFQENLNKAVSTGGTLFVLRSRSSSAAHAINIQCDPEKKIYRFIDDNLGVVKFNSQKELFASLQSWYGRTYPEHSTFEIEQFETL